MLRTFLITATALLVSACQGPAPIMDYDPSADFADYKTFAFVSDNPLIVSEGTGPVNPMLEGRLMRAIETELTARGYEKVAREDADFGVSFTVGSREKIRVDDFPEPYRGRWGWGVGYYGTYGSVGMESRVDVDQYTEGVLAIDIFDSAKRAPVWHSVATKRLTIKMLENPEASIREAVQLILAGFPPGEE